MRKDRGVGLLIPDLRSVWEFWKSGFRMETILLKEKRKSIKIRSIRMSHPVKGIFVKMS